MKDFITLNYLNTLTGCVFVVILLTQFTKELIDMYVKKIPTKYIAFLYALGVILGYQIATGTFTLNTFFLTLINAVIVTMTAQGGYEWIFAPIKQKEDIKNAIPKLGQGMNNPETPKEIKPLENKPMEKIVDVSDN